MNYDESYNYLYNEISGENSVIMLGLIADDNTIEGLKLIRELTSCDDNTAKLLWVDLKCDFGTKENNAILQVRENYEKEVAIQEYKYRNNAECPYCHSKNTKKISSLSKAGSVAIFGVFALGKVSKQWHCNNCNSDF